MTIVDFFTSIYKMEKDTKMVFNKNCYSELEIRLFLIDNSPTVESIFNFYMGQIKELIKKGPDMQIMGYKVKNIVYHHAHKRSERFYEIIPE